MDTTSQYQAYFTKQYPKLLEEYKQFLSFSTISADFLHQKNAFSECVQWIEQKLQEIGFEISQFSKNGTKPPVIIAEKKSTHPNAPTVTIYNHYDVQPVDPLEEWQHNPFTPYVDSQNTVWARGAQDNKGQLFYVLTALKALHEQHKNNLPITIRLLIEGEEESGSSFLAELIPSLTNRLKSDYSMIIDMNMSDRNRPAITFGSRGLVAMTVRCIGTKHDLHSGLHGGLAMNPLHALVETLASLRSPSTGKIQIDGFYDSILPMDPQSIQELASLEEETWKKECGQSPTGGEKGLSMSERNWCRPTLEINGIHGGYGGPGSKTVIPKEAIAKITCRLVPGQDPEKIGKLVQQTILKRIPEGVSAIVEIHEGKGEAIREPFSSHLARTLRTTMKEIWGKAPDTILAGGSIPILSLLRAPLGGELVLWGVGLESDHIHAPNEHFDMERMERGFLTTCRVLENLSNIQI